jgi:beta-lactamase regulating signal transducer with metallopeptidase domain
MNSGGSSTQNLPQNRRRVKTVNATFSLLSSAGVEAAAWRVADISWRASVVAAVVLAVVAVARKGIAPRWRFALWALVLVRFAMPWTPAAPWSLFGVWAAKPPAVDVAATAPVVGPTLPREPLPVVVGGIIVANPKQPSPPAPDATVSQPAGPGVATATPEADRNWVGLAAMAWLAVATLLILREPLLAWRLWRRKRAWRIAEDPALGELYARCRTEADVARNVPLLVAPDDAGPATVGAWRAGIVLPASMVDAVPASELRLVLLHELMHCRRRDVLIDRLAALVAAIHWFNPLVWFALARLRAEREIACDAAVLDLVGLQQRGGYGHTVLNVMERYVRPAPRPGLVGFGQQASVARRIGDIAGYRHASRRSRAIAGAVFWLIVLGGFTSAMRGQAPALQVAPPWQAPAPASESAAGSPEAAPPAGGASAASTMELSGRCVDGATPVGDVRLRVLRVDYMGNLLDTVREGRAGNDGTFGFADLPTPPVGNPASNWHYAVVATAPGRASGFRRFHPEWNDERVIQIEMPKAASLRGRVTDDMGRAIAGATVWAWSPGNDPLEGFTSVTTDAEGHFEINDLGPWDPAKAVPHVVGEGVSTINSASPLNVTHPAFARKRVSYTSVPAKVDFTLQPAATIVGMVFDEVTGAPAPGVAVGMQATNDTRDAMSDHWHTAITDDEGHYNIPSVTAGKYNIWADAKDRTCAAIDSFEVTAGKQVAAPFLRLIEGGWIDGIVVNADGGPYAKTATGRAVQIGIYGPSRPKSGAAIQSVTVDERGRFRMRAAPGTNYPYICVQLDPGLQSMGPGEVEVRAGQDTGLVFRVVPGAGAPVLRPAPPPVDLPLPVEAEREAAAEIRRLGGWYELDEDEHVVEVNMVYYDADGQRRDNDQVTDEALPHIASFPRLEVLMLHEGQASDAGLAHIRELKQIERVLFWDAAAVSDVGAAFLAELPNLASIHLSGSQITDEAIHSWQKLPKLHGLSLQGNRFTNKALEYAAGIPNLRELFVGNGETQITDVGLVHLTKLASLERLDLQRADITDAGIMQLETLGRLKELWLSGTNVTPDGLAKLAAKLPDLNPARSGIDAGERNALRGAIEALIQNAPPPKLAYLAWQIHDESDGEGPVIGPLWAADGSAVDPELEAKLRAAFEYPLHNRRPEDRVTEARPLVLFFKDESPLDRRTVMPFFVTEDGRRLASGSSRGAPVAGFRVSALAPTRPFEWPEQMTLEVRCESESPKLVKELREIPEEPVELGDDFTWVARQNDKGQLETVLSSPRISLEDRTVDYAFRVYAKGNQWPAERDGGYSTIVDDRLIDVTPFNLEDADVDLVRFYRQGFIKAMFDDVPLRLDLLKAAEESARE